MIVNPCHFAGRLLRCSRGPCFYQPVATKFYEADRKGGYDTKVKRPLKQLIKDGVKDIKPEVIKWKDEFVKNVKMENMTFADFGQHNDYEIVWKFDDHETVSDWIFTADRDHGEGKSSGEFVLGPNNTGIFRGNISTDVPKDGVIKRAGYVNIRSPVNMVSFKRVRPLDWERYTHLLMRVRGDGRPYNLCIGMERYFDVNWNDQYNYMLFTRGGPYWQIAKIPFNKFYLSGKGRVQDKQQKILLDNVRYFGITISDGYSGPFHLEIDWIGCIYDESHNDEFVYELYDQGYLMSD